MTKSIKYLNSWCSQDFWEQKLVTFKFYYIYLKILHCVSYRYQLCKHHLISLPLEILQIGLQQLSTTPAVGQREELTHTGGTSDSAKYYQQAAVSGHSISQNQQLKIKMHTKYRISYSHLEIHRHLMILSKIIIWLISHFI